MSFEQALSIFGIFLLFKTLWVHFWLARHIQGNPLPPRLDQYPSVTVIRPIKGLDYGLKENLKAALEMEYPGEWETIFVLEDAKDFSYPFVKEALEEFVPKGVKARVIFAGPPPKNRTGKLNNLIAAYKDAHGELIASADSDTRPARNTLRLLVETLMAHPQSGSAFAPVVVQETPETIGDTGYAIMLNSLYSPAANYASHKDHGIFPYIMGQFMLMRRSALEAIGGFESAEGQLVDDMFLGMKMNQAAYQNIMSPESMPIIHKGISLPDFILVYIRWIAFGRSGLGMKHPSKWIPWMRGLSFLASFVLSLVSLGQGYTLATLFFLGATLANAWSANRLHELMGGAPLKKRHWWVSTAIILTGPLVLLITIFKREVHWRGRTYPLNFNSRLTG